MRARSHWFIALPILALAIWMFSCTGGRKPPTSPTSADAEHSAERSAFLPGDAELMRRAYALARAEARDTLLILQADALAEEAYIQALAGAEEEAFVLWMEAISLLEPSAGDTTLQMGE